MNRVRAIWIINAILFFVVIALAVYVSRSLPQPNYVQCWVVSPSVMQCSGTGETHEL